MSLNDWFARFAPWIIVAIGFAVIVPSIRWLDGVHGYQAAYQDHAVVQAKAEAERELMRICVALPREEMFNCVNDVIKSAGEIQRAEEDLRAQKDMSAYALGMLIISAVLGLLSIGLTLYGVLLLRETLVETREATKAARGTVDITRKVGQAQVRAYVAIGSIVIDHFVPGEEPSISFRIKNVGQSPAIGYQNVSTYRLVEDPDMAKVRFLDQKWDGHKMNLSVGASSSQISRLPMLTQDVYDGFLKRERMILFVGIARYRDVFGATRRNVFSAYLNPSDLAAGKAALLPTVRHNSSN